MMQQLAHLRYDRLLVWAECISLLAVVGAYMYFVTFSVVEAVVRSELVHEIREAEARVSSLESAYFAHLDSLTPSILEEYSLLATVPTAYVEVDATDGRLTRRE